MNSGKRFYPARVSGERRGHPGHRLAFLDLTLRFPSLFGALVLCHLRQENRQPCDGHHGLVFLDVYGLLLDLVFSSGRA